MLRFVTHKLKTQSLNEADQPFEYKSDDDDRDSGTESDDENTEYEESKEAMVENGEEGLDGNRRFTRGRLIHPSRPPNFDEETSTGSPDDLLYSSSHHCGGGGTFHDLSTSMLERTEEEEEQEQGSEKYSSQVEHHSRARRLRRRSDGRYHRSAAAPDRTATGESLSNSAPRSLSHAPSPVSSSMLDVDSALPSDSDHYEHQTSEDELEVINNKSNPPNNITNTNLDCTKQFNLRGKSIEDTAVSVSLTSDDEEEEEEKSSGRQVRQLPRRSSRRTSNTNLVVVNESKCKPNRSKSPGDKLTTTTTTTTTKRNKGHRQNQGSSSTKNENSTYQPEKRKWSQANRRSCGDSSAGSSDEEVRDLMYVCSPSSPPVEFCTSPPAELIRPTRSTHAKATTVAAINQPKVAATFPISPFAAGSASNNYNNNFGNLISTNFSAFSYISVSLPCSPSPFVNGNTDGISRSPPDKLFHFSSSNFLPFEVCAVSPRKRHRQSASSVHHYHHHQPQFQPAGVVVNSSEPPPPALNGGGGGGIDGLQRHHHYMTNLSNSSGSINHNSNNVINQFNPPTNGCSSSSSNGNRHNASNANASQRNGGGVSSANGGGGGHHHPLRQRPCLDFEKMQQMRDRAVSGWRAGNHELSLTC